MGQKEEPNLVFNAAKGKAPRAKTKSAAAAAAEQGTTASSTRRKSGKGAAKDTNNDVNNDVNDDVNDEKSEAELFANDCHSQEEGASALYDLLQRRPSAPISREQSGRPRRVIMRAMKTLSSGGESRLYAAPLPHRTDCHRVCLPPSTLLLRILTSIARSIRSTSHLRRLTSAMLGVAGRGSP